MAYIRIHAIPRNRKRKRVGRQTQKYAEADQETERKRVWVVGAHVEHAKKSIHIVFAKAAPLKDELRNTSGRKPLSQSCVLFSPFTLDHSLQRDFLWSLMNELWTFAVERIDFQNTVRYGFHNEPKPLWRNNYAFVWPRRKHNIRCVCCCCWAFLSDLFRIRIDADYANICPDTPQRQSTTTRHVNIRHIIRCNNIYGITLPLEYDGWVL